MAIQINPFAKKKKKVIQPIFLIQGLTCIFLAFFIYDSKLQTVINFRGGLFDQLARNW